MREGACLEKARTRKTRCRLAPVSKLLIKGDQLASSHLTVRALG